MTYEEMEAADAALAERLKAARALVRDLERQRHELRAASTGIAIGDIVTIMRRGPHQGCPGIVRKIGTHASERIGSKPWLQVSHRTRDGSWSRRTLEIFNDWEKAPVDA